MRMNVLWQGLHWILILWDIILTMTRRMLKGVCRDLCDSIPTRRVTFYTETLRTEDIAVEKKYPGVRLTLSASIDTIRQDVSMDIDLET